MYKQRRTLRCGGRPKAFWGAIIGAATSIAGSLLGNAAEKKKQRLANSKEDYNQSLQEGQSMSNALNQSLDYQNNYYDQYRVAARYGRRSLADNGHKIVITDGGDAKRIGHNTFLLRGGSHEDVNETGQTGIGINVGGNEIEAEGGEVAQKKGNSLRIFSAQPILNGISPAQAVIQGADKNKVFKAQQKYKKNNHLKDDGTKAKYGSEVSKKRLHVNEDGTLTDIFNRNNYHALATNGEDVVIIGKRNNWKEAGKKNTSNYFDPMGAINFLSATGAPILNFTPSNIVGSIRDSKDYKSFMNNFMNYNNGGFFTKNYSKNHPYISFLGNTIGDGIAGHLSNKGLDLIRGRMNYAPYRKLTYKTNKLLKKTGLYRSGNNKSHYDTDYYTDNLMDKITNATAERNPSKYLENIGSNEDLKLLKDYYSKRGIKPERAKVEAEQSFRNIAPTNEEIDRLSKIYIDNPEYMHFINSTIGTNNYRNPLSQESIDAFLTRQGRSIRGVHADDDIAAEHFLTTTKLGRHMPGGDRLGTKGGLYTSNSTDIANRFKNPEVGQSDGYVGTLQFDFNIDKTKSIEDQLYEARNQILYDNSLNNSAYEYPLSYFVNPEAYSKLRNYRKYKAIESQYGRSNGEFLPSNERAYLPNGKGTNRPVRLTNVDKYIANRNERGRWGAGNVSNDLFIGQQPNNTTDFIRDARILLTKVPNEEEYNKLGKEIADRMYYRDDKHQTLTNNTYLNYIHDVYDRNPNHSISTAKKLFIKDKIDENIISPMYWYYDNIKKSIKNKITHKQRYGGNNMIKQRYSLGGDIRSFWNFLRTNKSPIANIAAIGTAYQKLNPNSDYNKMKGKYSGGKNFRGAGANITWTNDYKPKKGFDNFNDAYDDAVDHNAETFIFGGKRYNTLRENNPLREINNRAVGIWRDSIVTKDRNGYGKDFGPIKGPATAVPMITETYVPKRRKHTLGGRPKAEDGTLKYYNGVQETDAIPTRLFNERRRLTYTNSDYTAGPSDITDQIMDYINSKTGSNNPYLEEAGFRGRGGSKGGRRFKGTSGRNPKSAPSLGDLMTGKTKLTGKGKTASLTTATPTNIKPKPISNPLPTENINAYPFYKMLGEVSRFRGLPGKVQQPRVPGGIASSKEAGDAAMKAAEASNDVLQSLQKVYRLRHPFARSTPKETYNPNRFNREYRAARNNGMTREEFTRSQSANKRKAGKYTSLALAMPAAAVIATKVIGKDDVNGGSKDNINTQLSPYIARPVEQLNKGNKPVQKKQVTKAKGNTLPEVVVTAKKPTTTQYKGNVTKGNYQLHDGESKTINGIKYTRSGNTIVNHKTNVGYVYDKNGNYTGQADYSKVGKNFNEAFDAARKAGRNDFIYRAGKYNKYSTNKEEDAKKEALNRRIGAKRIARRLGGYSRPVERFRCGGSARPKASRGGIYSLGYTNKYGTSVRSPYEYSTSYSVTPDRSGYKVPTYNNNVANSSNTTTQSVLNGNINNGGYKNTTFTTGDYIGLGIDTAAALATGIINYRGAGNYSLPERSGFIQAGKLKTNYNVNPQVAELERARDRMAQDVYRNSSSSVAALNRANILNVNAAEDINKLLAEKENKETELINQDILNRQSVSEKNIANQMAYNNSVAEIKNAANQSRINAINGSLSGLSQAWTNFYTAGRSAFEDNQARIAAIAASEKGSLSRMLLSGYRLDDNTLANLYRNEENKDTKQLILNSMSPRARRRLGII